MKHFYFNCLMAVFAMFLSVHLYGQTTATIDGIRYKLDGVEAYVTGYTGKPVDVTIPETITTKGLTFKVTAIYYWCFKDCSSLVKLQADYVTSINSNCFDNCTNLKEVRIRNIRHIESNAFNCCYSLKVVDLGNHPIEFDTGNDIASIFTNCYELSYIVIPDGSVLWHSSSSLFSDCNSLQSIIYLGSNMGKQGSNAKTYTASGLVNWGDNSFTYTGKVPELSYNNAAPADFQIKKNRFQWGTR